jgi:hypothetical protein
MNRTVTLELPNARARAAVAGHVVFALAVKCGAGLLAAERLRRSVEDAATAAPGSLRLDAAVEPGCLTLSIISGDRAWLERALETLAAHGAAPTGGGLELRMAVHRLRPVEHDV